MVIGTGSSKVGVHNTAAAGTGWVSDSWVVCRARHGLSWLLEAYVSAGLQWGSVSAAVSYDAPVVSSAGVSNVASSGAMSVSAVSYTHPTLPTNTRL